MPESWEVLTRDGLIYRVVNEIAEIEQKREGGRWKGADRNYVLDLVRDTIQAVDGIRGTQQPATPRGGSTGR
jgi:hypothetical protein